MTFPTLPLMVYTSVSARSVVPLPASKVKRTVSPPALAYMSI